MRLSGGLTPSGQFATLFTRDVLKFYDILGTTILVIMKTENINLIKLNFTVASTLPYQVKYFALHVTSKADSSLSDASAVVLSKLFRNRHFMSLCLCNRMALERVLSTP